MFEKELNIEIENADNLPLEIKQVKVRQLATFIVAELKKGIKYSLMLGNPKLNESPKYDLDYFFKDKISKQLPEITTGIVELIPAVVAPPKPNPFWQQKWFLWMCIAIGGAAVFFFSYNMLGDMKKNS